MAMPPNPLSKPHLDQLLGLSEPVGSAGPEEIERRVQELLNEWLKFYFSGEPFLSPGPGGAMETQTFERCALLFDQADPDSPTETQVLHMTIADRQDGPAERRSEDAYCCSGRWTFSFMVRSHPNQPAKPGVAVPQKDVANQESLRKNRRAADQLRWLFYSDHTTEIAVKGITKIRVENGPKLMPAGGAIMRQLLVSAEIRYTVATHGR